MEGKITAIEGSLGRNKMINPARNDAMVNKTLQSPKQLQSFNSPFYELVN